MTKTTNYQLPKWEKTDRIQMKDFNDMTATLDAALKANADAIAEHGVKLTQLGNCEIVCGSYIGDGQYGVNHPNILTFEHKPLILAMLPGQEADNASFNFLAVHGAPFVNAYPTNYTATTIIWGEKSVSWYAPDNYKQYNHSGITYHYVALLAADQ